MKERMIYPSSLVAFFRKQAIASESAPPDELYLVGPLLIRKHADETLEAAVKRAIKERPKVAAIIRELQLNELCPAAPLPDGEPLPVRQEPDLGPSE